MVKISKDINFFRWLNAGLILIILLLGFAQTVSAALQCSTTGPLYTITVTPNPASVVAGSTQPFTATGYDSFGCAVSITPTWNIYPKTLGTISSGGVLATYATVTGSGTVTATSGSIIGSASFTVTAGPLATIIVTPNQTSVVAGATLQFTATGYDAYKNIVPITPTWSTTIGTISSGLLVTSVTGSGTVTAKSGSIIGSASFTVTAGPLSKITVTPNQTSVVAGATLQFTATGYDAYKNIVSITPTWSTTIGNINSSGFLLTYPTIIGSGTVTATSGLISGSASFTVTAAPLATIIVTPNQTSVVAGATQQFTATGYDANKNVVSITPTWSTNIGTISSSGLLTAPTTPGSGTVTAASGSISGSASFTVTAGPTPPPTTVQPTTVQPTTVQPTPSPWITGKVTDANTGDPVQGATVTIDGNSTITGSDGGYQLVVSPGNYNITVNKSGYNTTVKSVNVSGIIAGFDLSITPTASTPQWWLSLWFLILITIILVVAAVIFYFWTRGNLRLMPKQTTIPSDGKSTLPIKVQFVNAFGKPRKQRKDREVEMETTSGKIQNIVIPAGKEFAEATLTSSTESGTVTITAKSGKQKAIAQVSFASKEIGLDIQISPIEIPGDGKSTAIATIKIKDEMGNYTISLNERTVELITTLGTITNPVKIPPKTLAGTATITSGPISGAAIITASSGQLKGEGKMLFAVITKRYCPHCGAPISIEAKSCPKCGKDTFISGEDTKQCSACGAVIPLSAKFCSECGARQPV